ncbi:MAG: hypothetical protein IMY69_05275 [Bacteroidetes bacterium]|jgi:hypothetical protein|nr:hypothetical protein [Bacteroidota bacterium]MCK4406621.1 hypothetical protein [Bacteroidales bacterium]MCK4638388.1 hypothetical protein [Bacteroidales bacterium]
MELTIFILFYLILVVLLTIEGAKRTIGGWAIFIISLLLTPVIGVLVLFISQKKLHISYFIKNQKCNHCEHEYSKDSPYCMSCKEQGDWIKIKPSEIKKHNFSFTVF